MKVRAFALAFAALLATQVVNAAEAPNAPAEKTSISFTRTLTDPFTLQGDLSKNEYRTETIQAPYEVQIPYQATETYEEQIPYQDTETYTENIPYYETETYTERVPYTEREPYTDTETYYEREHQCRNVTEYEQECRNEPTCHTEPGQRQCSIERICRTDRTGREVCFDKEVCRQVGGGQQVCRDNRVCRNVPVTRHKCEYVNVPRTRTVTRYRDVTHYRDEVRTRTVTRYRSETRTRTVTRYRTETRTRTVTRYRTETKCCRPEQRQVFVRSWQLQIRLNIDPRAVLTMDQVETFNVRLTGTAKAPSAVVEVESGFYRYQVIPRGVSNGVYEADIKMISKYTGGDLAEYRDRSKIGEPEVHGSGRGLIIYLRDATAEDERVKTSYELKLYGINAQGQASEIGRTTVERSEMKTDGRGHLVLPALLIVQSSELEKWAQRGSQLLINVKAIRESSAFENGRIELERQAQVTIE